MDPSFIEIYHSNNSYQFKMWITSLMDPANIITIFDSALHNHLKWPANDCAMKQQIYLKKPSPQQVIKMGWSTTLIMEEGGNYEKEEVQSGSEEVEEYNEYQMVRVEKSLGISVTTTRCNFGLKL